VKRALAALGLAALAVVATASPAAAHSGKVVASDYKATITHNVDVPGVRVRLIEGGGRLELTSTRATVVVLGYEDEPYLRIGPRGVEENLRSPSTYVNRSLTSRAEPPASADAKAAPRWHRTSTGSTARWHDHRTHYMGTPLPDRVTPWQITFVLGGDRHTVSGALVHVPGPSTVPWLAVAIVLAAIAIGAGRRALVPALVALLVLDAVRVAGLTFEAADGRLAQAVNVGIVDLVGWALAITALVRIRAAQHDGVLAAGVTGLLLAIAGGVLDWGDLGKSQLAVVTPAPLHRFCIAAVAGLGAGLAFVALREAGRVPLKPASTPPAS
jgi:hypothetical protein